MQTLRDDFGGIHKQTAELQELKQNITIDKRLRMTWETEVTVTVMMERAERMQRAIDDEEEGVEGRFYWVKGMPWTRMQSMSHRHPPLSLFEFGKETIR